MKNQIQESEYSELTEEADKLLMEHGWIKLSKELVKNIGLKEGVILSHLWSTHLWSHKKEGEEYAGWFQTSHKDIKNSTSIKTNAQIDIIKSLIDKGLVEKNLVGYPPKNFYRIDEENLIEFLKENKTPICSDRNTRKREFNIPKTKELVESLNKYPEWDESLTPNFPKSVSLKSRIPGNLPYIEKKDIKKNSYIYQMQNLSSSNLDIDSNTEGEIPSITLQKAIPSGRVPRVRSTPIPTPQPLEEDKPKKAPDPSKSAGTRLMRSNKEEGTIGFAELIASVNNMPPPRGPDKFWSTAIPLGKMVVEDGIEEERIRNLIQWLNSHHSDIYVPTFSDVFQFRRKFFQLEKSMKRESSERKPSNGKVTIPMDYDGKLTILPNGSMKHDVRFTSTDEGYKDKKDELDKYIESRTIRIGVREDYLNRPDCRADFIKKYPY